MYCRAETWEGQQRVPPQDNTCANQLDDGTRKDLGELDVENESCRPGGDFNRLLEGCLRVARLPVRLTAR